MHTPYPGNYPQIEQVAASLLNSVRKAEGICDLRGRALLDSVVARTGGTVRVLDDPSQQEVDGGTLLIKGEKDYWVFLSPFTTPLRDNFTIAHELGHFVLHFFLAKDKPSLPISFLRYGEGRLEAQANRFAAAILMPEVEFRDKVTAFSKNRYQIAGYFEVSVPAVEVRAGTLGISLDQ